MPNTTKNSQRAVANNRPSSAVLAAKIKDVAGNVMAWERKELEASNIKLYTLLQDAYGLYKQFVNSKQWNALLGEYLNTVGRPVRANTPMIGKVVRAVFDERKHNVAAWIGALRIAHKHKVPEHALAQWLADNGGPNSVRRNITLTKDKGDVLTRAQLIDKAMSASKALPVLAEAAPRALSVPDFAGDGHKHDTFTLALAVNESGKLKIVHHTQSASLVEDYLARLGKVLGDAGNRAVISKQEGLSALNNLMPPKAA